MVRLNVNWNLMVRLQGHARFRFDTQCHVGFHNSVANIGSIFASAMISDDGFDVFHEVRNDRASEDGCRAELTTAGHRPY